MSIRIAKRIKFRNISSISTRRTPLQRRSTYTQHFHLDVASRPPHPRAPLPSGISFTASLTAVVLSIATIAAWTYTFPSAKPQLEEEQDSVSADSDQTLWIQVYPGMSAQIPPGRPGNLTKEQELKLRELWEAIMGICGTWPNAVTSMESDRTSQTEPESAKKKRGLGRLLGRGKKSEEDSADAEDKHGQNKEFREALASQSPEEIRNTMWAFTKADDPDAMLLRFLRARKWNVHDALVMAIATIHWRGKVVHLDEDIMKQGEGGALERATTGTGAEKKDSADFLAQLRMGKSYLHGEDKEGRPICLVRVKLHKQGEQTEASLERYTVYTIETARLMLRPPVDTAMIFFDMTGFSMANMDYSPVKFMIKVFEANYPESLGAVLVHQAPWVFQGIWSVIKGWLDPVVASKVHFTKSAQDLSQFIDAKHIPKDLGGEEDWTYKYVEPVPGENDRMKDTVTRQKLEAERASIVREYEAATIKWSKSGDMSLNQTRLQLAEKLRKNYWQLDPYVRARSLYDRWGVIRGGGVVDFYPSASRGTNGSVPARMQGHQTRMSTDQNSVYYDAQSDVD